MDERMKGAGATDGIEGFSLEELREHLRDPLFVGLRRRRMPAVQAIKLQPQ